MAHSSPSVLSESVLGRLKAPDDEMDELPAGHRRRDVQHHRIAGRGRLRLDHRWFCHLCARREYRRSARALSTGAAVVHSPTFQLLQGLASVIDVLCMGRSSIDLYAHEIGVPITGVKRFDAYVGGCPANVSVGNAPPGVALGAAHGRGHRPGRRLRPRFFETRRRERRLRAAARGTPHQRSGAHHPAARYVSAHFLSRQLRRSGPDDRACEGRAAGTEPGRLSERDGPFRRTEPDRNAVRW